MSGISNLCLYFGLPVLDRRALSGNKDNLVASAAQRCGQTFVPGSPQAFARGEKHHRVRAQCTGQSRLEVPRQTDLTCHQELRLKPGQLASQKIDMYRRLG